MVTVTFHPKVHVRLLQNKNYKRYPLNKWKGNKLTTYDLNHINIVTTIDDDAQTQLSLDDLNCIGTEFSSKD